MKHKYAVIICLVLIFMLYGIIDVKADNYSCDYKAIETTQTPNEKFSIVIKEKIGESLYIDLSVGRVGYGNIYNDNKAQVGNKEFFSIKNITTILEYNKETGIDCPPYFYVFSPQNSAGYAYDYIGFFSDKPKEKLLKDNDIAVFLYAKLTNDSTVKEDKDGTLTPIAEKYSCELKNGNFKLGVSINYSDKTIGFSNANFKNKDEYIKNFDFSKKNVCPDDLKVCKLVTPIYDVYEVFQKDEITGYEDNPSYECVPLTDSGIEVTPGTDACKAYVDLKTTYLNSFNSEDYGTSSKALDKLKKFCNSVLMYQDYSEDEFSCINLCLNIHNDIKQANPGTRQCGFSEKLILFIANIVKWIKYIIPVVVIVLGILDFIQAIAADKDDGMKKTQGRFVKRLIAAVLIFIIPFIIEFVLDKMGFGANGCGIIDL